MATFVFLANFTEQGLRNVKESPRRVEAFKNNAKQLGCTVKEFFWTQGQYDMIAVVEASDETAASVAMLSSVKLGNVTGQSLRAFTAAEMQKLLDKVA